MKIEDVAGQQQAVRVGGDQGRPLQEELSKEVLQKGQKKDVVELSSKAPVVEREKEFKSGSEQVTRHREQDEKSEGHKADVSKKREATEQVQERVEQGHEKKTVEVERRKTEDVTVEREKEQEKRGEKNLDLLA